MNTRRVVAEGKITPRRRGPAEEEVLGSVGGTITSHLRSSEAEQALTPYCATLVWGSCYASASRLAIIIASSGGFEADGGSYGGAG